MGSAWKGGLRIHGYKVVRGKGKVYEHRDEWEKHNGPIPPNHVVHHINGNRADNRIENLQLMSKAEHQRHHAKEISEGKLKSDKSFKPKGELHHMAKFSNALVLQIRKRLANGERGTDLAKEFNVCQSAISKLKHRTRWAHI
jgi:hypothetical protein